MKKVSSLVSSFPILLGLLLSPNCATLIRDQDQRIPVTSTPVGAKVSVNGFERGVTPLVVMLDRKSRDQVIRIESPGYDPVEIRPKRRLSEGPILGNVIMGAVPGIVPATLIGLTFWVETDAQFFAIWALCAAVCGAGLTAVDAGNGKGYGFQPADLTVKLRKADGTPRVDTMLVDAQEFRNIKWIRVQKD